MKLPILNVPGIFPDSTLRDLPDTLTGHRLKDQKGFYGDVVAPRTDKHGGYVALDGVVQCQTQQCCHCPAHWVVRKGSGIIRHFCPKCHQVTCGNYFCQPQFCKTWEQKMDEIEAADRRRREVESWLNL